MNDLFRKELKEKLKLVTDKAADNVEANENIFEEVFADEDAIVEWVCGQIKAQHSLDELGFKLELLEKRIAILEA